jgi:hypothetical protein
MEGYHMELTSKVQIFLEWTYKLFQIYGDKEESLFEDGCVVANVQHRLVGTEKKAQNQENQRGFFGILHNSECHG